MDEKEKRKTAHAIHQQANQFRGRFLNHVAVIERRISLILIEYFCARDEAKRELFLEKVAEKLSLEQKKRILIEIVKRDYPRFWDDHRQILNALQEIQEFRNKLAHSTLDVSDEALKRPIQQGVGFVLWKNAQPVTERDVDELVARATMVIETLEDIERLLPFKEIAK